MSGPPPTLTVYADYVCPFCYLGEASLRRYLDGTDEPPDVAWHPFDLRSGRRAPDGSLRAGTDVGKDDAYFAQVGENVERLRDRYDVEMARTVARDVDSWNAQLLALAVQRERDRETFASLHRALFDAVWADARDVGDPAVVVDVADGVGLEESFVRTALEDDGEAERLQERFERARRRGVTGVPTFVYDARLARGAVPPDRLAELVDGPTESG